MKSTQIKIAYGLGAIQELAHANINPLAFCKVAARSQDPGVQKLAAAVNLALRQIRKVSNIKQANADATFRHYQGVNQALGGDLGASLGAVKTAAANDAEVSAGLATYCLDEGISGYLYSYKTAQEEASEEMPAFLEGSEDDEEEDDEEGDEEGDEDEPKTAQDGGDGSEGGDGAQLSPEDIVSEIQALVESGELSPEQASMMVEELNSGMELA